MNILNKYIVALLTLSCLTAVYDTSCYRHIFAQENGGTDSVDAYKKFVELQNKQRNERLEFAKKQINKKFDLKIKHLNERNALRINKLEQEQAGKFTPATRQVHLQEMIALHEKQKAEWQKLRAQANQERMQMREKNKQALDAFKKQTGLMSSPSEDMESEEESE